MNVLVTGANGMIGSRLVNALIESGIKAIGVDITKRDGIIQADLDDKKKLCEIIKDNNIDRVIHLAALAHTEGVTDLSWKRYYHINVECAKNVFESAGVLPVLFISTIDVYGFYDSKEKVSVETPTRPVSKYGKSKALAEEECRRLPCYTIFRLSPVYTDDNKRDIQKRYYLKYPIVAYQIGRGAHYEVLDMKHAVAKIVDWCGERPKNDIRIIKDDFPMWTPDYIKAEKEAGRAKVVLRIPKCAVTTCYFILKTVFGENEITFLLNKALHPLETIVGGD